MGAWLGGGNAPGAPPERTRTEPGRERAGRDAGRQHPGWERDPLRPVRHHVADRAEHEDRTERDTPDEQDPADDAAALGRLRDDAAIRGAVAGARLAVAQRVGDLDLVRRRLGAADGDDLDLLARRIVVGVEEVGQDVLVRDLLAQLRELRRHESAWPRCSQRNVPSERLDSSPSSSSGRR